MAADRSTKKLGSARKRALILTIACLVSAIASTALAGDIHGTLTVPTDLVSLTPPPSEEAASHQRYWEEWNGFIDPRPTRIDPSREIAVVLTGEGAAIVESAAPPLRIHNGSLQPATIVARAGTAFQIRNDDGCQYELYAEGNDEIAAVQTAPGNARPITIAAAGNWPLRERNYPHIRGHLHVLADLVARATVEPSGAYVFHGVPAGSYVLHVFHGDHETSSQPVAVTDAALTIPAIQVTAAAAAAAH